MFKTLLVTGALVSAAGLGASNNSNAQNSNFLDWTEDTNTSLDLTSNSSSNEAVNLFIKGNKTNLPALHQFIKDGNTKMAQHLIKIASDINEVDGDGWTPLHWAVHTNNLELAKLLVERGANVLAENKDGKSPKEFAFLTNNIDFIKALKKQ